MAGEQVWLGLMNERRLSGSRSVALYDQDGRISDVRAYLGTWPTQERRADRSSRVLDPGILLKESRMLLVA